MSHLSRQLVYVCESFVTSGSSCVGVICHVRWFMHVSHLSRQVVHVSFATSGDSCVSHLSRQVVHVCESFVTSAGSCV